MPHPPSSATNGAKMQTKLSTWTPLNHLSANSKIFEERRCLLAKWFDRWSDSQRKAVLQDLVLSCSVEQLSFLSLSVSRRLPLQAADFTCLLPRAISLYIFSFLDPRSLCRCAQVSWHWKSIVELDQLWMPKCLRFGWCINFSPTQFEQAIWKRQYIQTVQELRLTPPQAVLSQHLFMDPVVTQTSSKNEETSELASLSEERSASTNRQFGSSSRMGKRNEKQPCSPIPWRDSDRNPKDTIRFNYLDNLDHTEQALTVQMKGRATTTSCTDTLKPDGRSKKTLSEANYKLRKAKSLMFLSSSSKPHHSPLPAHHPRHQPQTQTQCGSHSGDYAAKSLLRQAQWNAGIRPGPVRSAVPRLSVEALRASQRSHRSVPSTPLFEGQPRTVLHTHNDGE